MDEANADLTNSSWCNRNNSNETEPSSASRGNYRGGGRGNIRYQSHRGNYNSRWTSRNGRGGKNMNSSNQQKGETDENQKSRKFDKKVANYGIGYQKIEDLCTEMDQKKILPGSAELLASVQT
uniref:Uncharacterized protein n=1 Tax=Panagrolaimus superbus TaxID=310955 RepID=A0A914YXD6_9BILA